jgi:hypothetical protein
LFIATGKQDTHARRQTDRQREREREREKQLLFLAVQKMPPS